MSESAAASRSPLLVEDLFYVILDFLAEPTSPSPFDTGIPFTTLDPDGRRVLAVVARTCRAFTQPCLDRLWRRLTSLEPLLRCYASQKGRRLQFPCPAEWAVIKRYTHRIQQLEVQEGHSYFLLQCAIFESPLLPNLKALKWKMRSTFHTTSTLLIQPLLAPGLVILDFCQLQHDEALVLASFFQALPSRCPSLKSARFRIFVDAQSGLIDIFSQALCGLKKLESLTVDGSVGNPVNDNALQHLLMSPQFQELGLSIQSYHLRKFCPPPSDIPLRNIKDLNLRLDDLSQITEFLRPGNQGFSEIALHLERLEFATVIASLFTGLSSHPRKSTLRVLKLLSTHSLLGNNFSIQDMNLCVLSFNTFRPLICHTNLQRLIINMGNPITLNDEELAELAHNWPLLEILDLSYICPLLRQAKKITFRGLLSLAANCPELRQVALTLDGRQVPSGVAVSSKAIMALRFPNSPINNRTRLVAKFLLTHFPSLSDIRLQTDPMEVQFGVDRYAQEWLKVYQYLFRERAGG